MSCTGMVLIGNLRAVGWSCQAVLMWVIPGTAVLRLQDYYITNELIKVSGYAPDGATVKIVSSPNDLTQRAVDNDGFVPDVVPIDSQLNYTKILFYTEYSSRSHALTQPITADLLECVQGRSDVYTTRGFRCHDFVYPSYPAEISTDFYTKNCDVVVETTRAVLGDVDAGYTRGVFGYSYANAPDYEQWYGVTLNTPPEIECGPKIEGYHHVTKIEQNQTVSYSATYRFGSDQGMNSRGDLLTEIHGNVTLNNVDHDVHFNGTGLFEETVDLRETITDISEVIVRSNTLDSVHLDIFNLKPPTDN